MILLCRSIVLFSVFYVFYICILQVCIIPVPTHNIAKHVIFHTFALYLLEIIRTDLRCSRTGSV